PAGRRAVGAPRAAAHDRRAGARTARADARRPAPRAGLEAVVMYALPYVVLQWVRQKAINARRRDRTVRYLVWAALAGVANALLLALATAFVTLLLSLALWWLALPMIAVLIVPVVADA